MRGLSCGWAGAASWATARFDFFAPIYAYMDIYNFMKADAKKTLALRVEGLCCTVCAVEKVLA